MKKVLLISYHFPPDAAMGAVRFAKFAKYLPEFGWEPMVLSVKEKYYDTLDTAHRLNGLSPKVIRTRMFQKPIFYYHQVKKALGIGNQNAKRAESSDPGPNGDHGSAIKNFIGFFLSFPDEKVGWLPFAVFRGLQLVRRKDIAVLMTSGPPHSVHIAGACLSKLTRIPWIADFRDPYSDDVFKDIPGMEKGFPGYLTRKLEAWLISRAAIVLTTTDRFAERLRSRYPGHKQKVFTLPNGYDPDDFLKINKEKEKEFTISYLGSIYEQRDPEPVLRAISELINEKQIDPGKLVFRLIGNCNSAKGRAMNSLISKHGLSANVEILPWMPRHEALEVMARSNVLLLLAEEQPLAVPGKVYDYLAAGSDILAITRDGSTADVIRETRGGGVVSPDDYQALKAAIKAFYAKYLSMHRDAKNNFSVQSLPLAKYSRRNLTENLTQLLETVDRPAGAKRT